MLNHLLPPTSAVFAFDGKSSPCIGVLPARLQNEYYDIETEIYVCPSVKANHIILSLGASKKLGYVNPDFPNVIEPKVIQAVSIKENHHNLPPLHIGQQVCVYDFTSKLWNKFGKVVEITQDRSHKVKTTSGQVYWRNRELIRPVPLDSPCKSGPVEESPPSPVSSKRRGRRWVTGSPASPRRSHLPRRPGSSCSSPTPSSRRAERGDDASADVRQAELSLDKKKTSWRSTLVENQESKRRDLEEWPELL